MHVLLIANVGMNSITYSLLSFKRHHCLVFHLLTLFDSEIYRSAVPAVNITSCCFAVKKKLQMHVILMVRTKKYRKSVQF